MLAQTSRDSVEDIYELSPLQQGMLFHTLKDPQYFSYFEQISFTIQGALNVPAFVRAWQHVVDRHPALRTSFYWEDLNKPLQVVHMKADLPIDRQDWRHFSLEEQQIQLRAYLRAERERGFELSTPPLLRLALLQLGASSYQFVLSFHHLLMDGWSLQLVSREVSASYKDYSQGRSPSLGRSGSYGEYIAWIQQRDLTEAEAFWRSKLAGFSAPNSLDLPPGQINTAEDYATVHISLGVDTTLAVHAFARRCKLTLNTLGQGAWAVLLSRYSGDEDVVFGGVVSGRTANLPDVESIVGLFINTLPVRVRVSPQASVLQWLSDLQTQQAEVRQYEYSPLVQVQQWSDVPARMPLFHSIFAFENYPMQAMQGDGSLDGVIHFERTNYPITVGIVPGPELTLMILYDPRRFEAPAIERMLGHYRELLEGIVADAGQRIGELPLLTAREREQLLVEWNQTGRGYEEERTVQEMFAAQAGARGEAVAVQYREEELSYEELNRRANQLGRYLRKLGVRAETRVGIMLPRSAEMVVGMLGVLKAGGAYVPLDVEYPSERLRLMVRDAGVAVVITGGGYGEELSGEGVVAVRVDEEWGTIEQESVAELESGVGADNLAYIIYTSGSTGTPKGVCITHRNIIRLFEATRSWFVPDELDVWTLFHSQTFDFSVWEMWGALLYGGKLVIVPSLISRSPDAFHALLVKERVTVLNQTPSAFRQLIEIDKNTKNNNLSHLRLVIFGGEALVLKDLQSWFDLHGDQTPELVNMYGITETTVHVTYRPVTICDLNLQASPIGRAIPDLQLYVLDKNLQPLPIGVPGELYVAGAGLARGYQGHPDLTAERFIPNPFSKISGSRLYRTGDLVRYQGNGDLEYVGREDHQVKVRGFRIELGEIEAQLSQHPEIKSSLVMAEANEEGEQKLVAYLVPRLSEQAVVMREVREWLARKLPEYMMPSRWVEIEQLPLTVNGKIDRRALAGMAGRAVASGKEHVEPRNEEEQMLAGLWGELLGVAGVGVHDDFFMDLGGHSLQATQLVSRIREAFQIEMPIQRIFELSNIASLAEHIQTIRWTTQGASVLADDNVEEGEL